MFRTKSGTIRLSAFFEQVFALVRAISEVAREAIVIYEQKGHVAGVRAAEALLAQLD